MFGSLRHRDFRLFLAGQFVSLVGTWMQGTALSWLLYRLTKDPLALGLATFVGQFPVLALGFHAGFIVDHADHLRLVRRTQFLSMVQAALLAALSWTGAVRVWHVYALSLMLGAVNAFDIPARQVLIGELVDEERRHNAIALNSTIVNVSRVVGPALAGLAIGWLGESVCFALNALSYVAVLVSLSFVRGARQAPPEPSKAGMWREVGEGLAYAFSREPIRLLLLILAVYSFVGLPVFVLLPIFADGILGVGARGLGILSSAAGLGATLGALQLARRPHGRGLGRVMIASLLAYGGTLVGLALSRDMLLSCAMMWGMGWAAILILAGANTALQELCDDRHRGRVMSFYSMVFIGASPIGSFLVGGAAARIGVSWTVALEGALVAAVALFYRERLIDALDRLSLSS